MEKSKKLTLITHLCKKLKKDGVADLSSTPDTENFAFVGYKESKESKESKLIALVNADSLISHQQNDRILLKEKIPNLKDSFFKIAQQNQNSNSQSIVFRF